MGAAIPGVVTGLLNQPTGQVIDGSVLIDGHFGGSYPGKVLNRTPSSAGNNRTWTLSYWFKKVDNGAAQEQMFVAGTGPAVRTQLYLNDHKLRAYQTESPEGTNSFLLNGTALLRDFGPGWYHICWVSDIPNGTFKCYVNNRLDMDGSVNTSYITQVNLAHQHTIGNHSFSNYNNPFTGRLSQMYMVDGQALDPSEFGFTDPLTNTWRPKKYTGLYLTNDVTTEGFAIKSSEQDSDGQIATNAFDGNIDNVFADRWRNNTSEDNNLVNNTWIGQDFGAGNAQDIRVINLLQGRSSGTGEMVGAVKVQYSDNGTDWSDAGSAHTLSTGGFGWQSLNVTPSGSHRYWRLLCTTTSSAGVWIVTEMEMFAYSASPKLHFGTDYFGTNSFYLPMDGNSPIGQDKSGNGNDWTPVNFGGSVELDKATGALPILNTTQGGTAAGVGVRTDAYASSLVLALPLVGNKEDVSNQINSGSSTKTVTVNNQATSTNRGNFYGGSFDFDGSGDRLVLSSYGSDFTFDGDFTIECWLYIDDAGSIGYPNGDRQVAGVWTGVNGDWQLNYAASGTHNLFQFLIYTGGGVSTLDTAVNSTPYVNRWVHLAVVRNSGSIKFYIDGISYGGSLSQSASFGQTSNTAVGGRVGADARTVAGSIQDFRIYKGVAKYTSNFIPASTNPDILPDTPSGVSGGSKLTKITDGAVYFDGSGDYLRIAASSDFDQSNGTDFTAEAYIYMTAASGPSHVMGFQVDGNNRCSFYFTDGTTTLNWYTNLSGSGSNKISTSTNYVSLNAWHHVAVTRSGSTTYLFVDGILQGTSTTTDYPSGNQLLDIGTYNASGYNPDSFPGFISNVRYIKGTALYTSNFTPPSAPLTNVTNTKLLCCQSNVTSGAAAVSPNISGINDGTVWSSTVSGPTRVEDRVANAFNGSTSGPGAIPAYPGTLTFAPGFTGLTTVKIYGYYAGSGVTLHVNGSQQSPSSGAFTLTISTSTLDSIVWTAVDGFNYMRIDAIEVDSTVLIDPVVGPDDSNEAATNFNPFTTDINTVRGQETGYCTLNPLTSSKFQSKTLKDGNLEFSGTNAAGSGYPTAFSNLTMNGVGKWYMEVYPFNTTDTNGLYFGICDYQMVNGGVTVANTYPGGPGGVAYAANGTIADNGSNTFTSQPTYTAGDVISVAYDADNGKVYFAKNGVYVNGANPVAGTNPHGTGRTGEQFFVVGCYNNRNATVNFGQKPFKFPPPDGFQPLNADNVRPETVISRPDQYVGIVTYTSNNSTLSVTDFKFRPDLLIFKNRDTANHWGWFDSVRGPNKWLRSSGTNNEVNTSGGGYGTGTMNSFDPFGFTLGDDVGANVTNYPSSNDHVVYGFKAGGNPGISSTTYWIDDKEYSASGAKMSVGSLNSLAYNQSAEWSDSVAGTPYPGQTVSRLFDGSVLTGLIPNNGTSLVFTTTAFPSITKLRIYGYSYTGNAGGIQVNGNDYTSLFNTGGGFSSSSKWVTIPVSSLEKIEWSIESNGLENGHLGAIEVDGKILVDTSVSINAPTIQPTGCSVGTKQGFSIVQFAGTSGAATIPHGLTQAPQFAIIRSNYSGANWPCYHTGLSGPTKYIWLNSYNGEATQAASWNSQDPTQFLFHMAGEAEVNRNGYHSIAYMWHDVPGLQKFGSYTGNGSTTLGAFVETGFKPALLWVKRRDSGSAYSSWAIYDSTRSKFNTTGTSVYNFPLWANLNAVEGKRGNGSDAASGSENIINFFSNGFMALGAGAELNVANEQYIYCAWAEVPTFNLYGGQANAR